MKKLSKKRREIINNAVRWINTPFEDGQCVKGVGTDCAMLCFGVAVESKILDPKTRKLIPNYSPEHHFNSSEELLEKQLIAFGCKETVNPKPGDMVLFRYGKCMSHVGIVINERPFQIIHAMKTMGKVVISDVNDELYDRIEKYYKFKGVI